MPVKSGQYLLADLILFLLWILTLIPLTIFLKLLYVSLHSLVLIVGAVLVLLATLILMAWLLPKPKAGVHPLSSIQGRIWFLNLQFSRIWMFPPFRHLIFSSSVLRTIFLKASGCQINLKHSFSTHAEIHDPSMISIGEGSVIGLHAALGGHLILNGKLYLMPVRVGKNCILGAEVKVMPGAQIGDGCVLEVASGLLVQAKVPSNCTIGHHSIISSQTRLSEGAKVPAFYRDQNHE